MFLFSVPDLSFCSFLCVSTRRICHCLAKTAGECYLCLTLPFFSLSLSLYHPSTLWGKHNVLHGQKNNHTKLRYILFIKASLPERTWGCEALWDHKHAFHILSESYGCFSSAQGVECGFLVWKRRMRSPEVMLECVEAFLGQLGAPGAVHGAESHAAFSNLFQIVKFLLSA